MFLYPTNAFRSFACGLEAHVSQRPVRGGEAIKTHRKVSDFQNSIQGDQTYFSSRLFLILETFANFANNMKSRFDEIGSLFLKRRKELGLTQQQLGDKVGVTKSEISKIENGRGITFSTINKLSEALGVSAQIELKPNSEVSLNVIHYIVMSMGMFARQFNLTKKEACNYLSRFKGLEFSIDNYEAEHQLSMQDCVDDMAAICLKNGGALS